MVITNKFTEERILAEIRRAESCALYQTKIDIEAGIRPVPEGVSKEWLLSVMQAELEARFLGSKVTIEEYCADKLKSGGSEPGGSASMDPLLKNNPEGTNPGNSAGNILPQVANINNTFPNWWKYGLALLIAYLLFKKE